MSTKLVNKGNSMYEISAVATKEEWAAAQDKAYHKLAQNVEIKGFRKGQAPFEMAKKHINYANVLDEAINICLPGLYTAGLVEHKLNPLYRPDVKVTKVSDTELEVTFEIVCMPEVKLGQYKGLNVDIEKVNVTADEIKHAIDHLLEDNADWVLKETEAKMGDTVVMDFTGYVDGKEFDGGSAKNHSLVLGSNSFIPGFEEQLVGAKPETNVEVNVTFPEQYVKELAGKKAKFVCKIHEIKEKSIPELTDEFAKELKLNGVTDIKSLEAYERVNILRTKNQQASQKQYQEIVDKIVASSKIDFAPVIIEKEMEAVRENNIKQIEQSGLTLEQYKEITGTTDETLNATFREQAIKQLSTFLVYNKIAETEKLTVTKDDVKNYYEDMAKRYNMKVEDVEKALKPQEQQLVQNLVQQKIDKFILDNNAKNLVHAEPEANETKEASTKKPAAKKSTKKAATEEEAK